MTFCDLRNHSARDSLGYARPAAHFIDLKAKFAYHNDMRKLATPNINGDGNRGTSRKTLGAPTVGNNSAIQTTSTPRSTNV